ncbi:MAG: amidohydrolase family protein, partial [Bdellovibrionales bacterium]|nr:amidohydrolase family protein [Bdellovibrionales bacterium]
FTPGSEIIYEHLPLLSKILKLNIPFVLGTDCAAANDQADMISEMKLTHLLCQDRGFKNLQLSEKILNSCTHQAAQAYGVDNWSTLKVGACADLNFFAKTLSTLPLQKPLENLIFSHSGQTLKHVMINGEWILYNQTPTKIDLECAKKDFTEALKIFRERIH